MKETIVKYSDIAPSLQTGDILTCEQHDWFWRLIGHTATIYRDSLTNMLSCFESTSISRVSGIKGVQLNPLGLWLDKYPGKVRVRQCQKLAGFEPKGKPEDFIQKYRGSSYPNTKTRAGRWKLILAAIDVEIFGHNIAAYHGKDKGIFCTELVVMFLRHLGIMQEKGLPAWEYEPDDFTKRFINDQMCPLIVYGEQIRIK